MPENKNLPHAYIKIDGADVAADFERDLLEVVVDDTLYLPSMFTIRLRDPEVKWADDATLDLGKAVVIEMNTGADTGATTATLMMGEITALEPMFSVDGNEMVVRGYTKAHRLHRGKKTRTFLSKLDSDVASTIAGEAGLGAMVDATTVTYDHLLQNNQTNWEFLQARAERLGYQVFAADGNLYFKKGDYNRGAGPTLEYGVQLIEFRPSYTGTHQPNSVTVKGWDYKAKTALSGTGSPNAALNQGGLGKTGGAAATTAFTSADAVITTQPVVTAAEATALATGLANDASRDFVQAEGTCFGDPTVKAGYKITISKVGTRFSGSYLVTSAQHVYRRDGYYTYFRITGRKPDTIGGMLQGEQSNEAAGRFNGVVVGVVTNLTDPDNLGRVKVKYSWLGEIESWWVRIASPMAGPTRGIYFLPEINDEVLLAFEHGDPHRPYLIGALWNSTDKPPENNSVAAVGGKVVHRIIKTRYGHQIIFDDTDNAQKITIKTVKGHQFVLDDTAGGEKISIIDKTANNKILIDSVANKISILCTGDMLLDAKGKIDMKAAMDVAVTGLNVNLKANASGKFEATAALGLKGTATTTVEDGAGAKIALTGPIVNINNGGLEVI